MEDLKSNPSIKLSTLAFAVVLALKDFFTLSASKSNFILALASESVSNLFFFLNSAEKCE
jgi:hypothetical protein